MGFGAKHAKDGGDKGKGGKHRGQPKVYDKKGREIDRTGKIVKKGRDRGSSGGSGKGGAADGLDRWG
jgi:hypothetical protein